MKKSLEGVKVIETATLLAAPVCGMMLGDFGADVIKIEVPGGGDQLRGWGYRKNEIPLYWKVVARNKRCITLDLRKPKGREMFLRLVAKADVYIENFRPGTPAKWGIDASTLRSVKPDLIAARISGFGQTGPYASRAGFGTLAEAMSGFAYANGWPDKPPTLPSFGMADAIAGITTAYGIMAALRHRDRTGEGQDVDVALYEPIMTIMGSLLIDYQQLGIIQERLGNTVPFAAPRNAYPTRDGKWIAVSCSTQQTTRRLLEAIGKPELIDDERFATNELRVKNNAALDEYVIAWMKARDYDDAMAVLERHGVTSGAINTAADILADEHIRVRGSIAYLDDEDLGTIAMQAPVPRMTGTPGAIAFAGRRSPGYDNAAVYKELLGLNETDLAQLGAEGVI